MQREQIIESSLGVGSRPPLAPSPRHYHRNAAINEEGSNYFPTDLSEAGAKLKLPAAVIQQFVKSGLKKLHDWQAECLGVFIQTQELCDHTRNLVYCAPTSGGKTMVALALMLSRVSVTGGRALYVLPLRATVKEKYDELVELLRPHNLNSHDGGDNGSEESACVGKIPVKNLASDGGLSSVKSGKGRVLICTYEKANILLNDLLVEAAAAAATVGVDATAPNTSGSKYSGVASSKPPPLVSVVIDEAHMLEDKVPMEHLLTKLRYLQRYTKQPPWVHNAVRDKYSNTSRSYPFRSQTADYSVANSLGLPSSPPLQPPCMHCQVIAFSATLPNAEALGAWLNDAVIYRAVKRPTPLTFAIAAPAPLGVLTPAAVERTLLDHEHQKQQQRNVKEKQNPSSSLLVSSSSSSSLSSSSALTSLSCALDSVPKESVQQEWRRLVDTVLNQIRASQPPTSSSPSSPPGKDGNGGAVLVFCGTKRDCEVAADNIAKERSRGNPEQAIHPQRRWVQKKMDRLEFGGSSGGGLGVSNNGGAGAAGMQEQLGLKEVLQSLLAQGVCYYHAQLPQGAKDVILDGFRRGGVDVLLSTSSLAVGVNLPVRCVVVRGVQKWASVGWEASEFRQMAGRAGRTGHCSEGACIIHCCDAKPQTLSLALKLLSDDPKPVNSPLSSSWRRCTRNLNCDDNKNSASKRKRAGGDEIYQGEKQDNRSRGKENEGGGGGEGEGSWPVELMTDEELEEYSEVRSLVPSFRAVILEGVASALVKDTSSLARFAESTFLWHQLTTNTNSIQHSNEIDLHQNSREDEGEEEEIDDAQLLVNRRRVLSCALSCALRHMVYARLVAISDDGRYGIRHPCPGCFDVSIGGECLELDDPREEEKETHGAQAYATTRQQGGYIVCPRCDFKGVRPLRVTPLGRAIFVAGLDPDEGLLLNQELARASKELFVGAASYHLHAIYLLTTPFNQYAMYPLEIQRNTAASTNKQAQDVALHSTSIPTTSEMVSWKKLLDLLPASEDEAARAIADNISSDMNEDQNMCNKNGLAEREQDRARRVAWEDKTTRRNVDAFATSLFANNTAALGVVEGAKNDGLFVSSASSSAHSSSSLSSKNDASFGFDFARHLLSSMPVGAGGNKYGRLPPNAAAILASPFYGNASISTKERGDRQRVAALATGSKLWGAMAIREVGPRDLDPKRAVVVFGSGFRSFFEANLIHMHQVLRFVRELHAGQSASGGGPATAASAAPVPTTSNDDPLYAYLKHVVKLLHKKVDRKLIPLYNFLRSGLSPRLSLALSKSLYRKRVRGVAHLAALASSSFLSSSSSSSASSSSSSSLASSMSVPVEVFSSLVEIGYLEDSDTKRKLQLMAASANAINEMGDRSLGIEEKKAADAMLNSIGQGILRAAHKAVTVRSSNRNRYKKTQSPCVQVASRRSAAREGALAAGPKSLLKRLSMLSTDSDLLSPTHQRGLGADDHDSDDNDNDDDSLDSSSGSSNSSESSSEKNDSDQELEGGDNYTGGKNGSDLDDDDDDNDDEGEYTRSKKVDKVLALDTFHGDWSDDEGAEEGGEDEILAEERRGDIVRVHSSPLPASKATSKSIVMKGDQAGGRESDVHTQLPLCTQLEVSQKATFAIANMLRKVPSYMLQRLQAQRPASSLLNALPILPRPPSPHIISAASADTSLASPLSWQEVLEGGWVGALSFAVVLRVCPRDMTVGKNFKPKKVYEKGGVSTRTEDSKKQQQGGNRFSRVSRVVAWRSLGMGKGILSKFPLELLPQDRGCAPSADRPYVVGGVGFVLGGGNGGKGLRTSEQNVPTSFFLPLPIVPPALQRRTNGGPGGASSSTSSSESSIPRLVLSPAHLVFSCSSLLSRIASWHVTLPSQLPPSAYALETAWYSTAEGNSRFHRPQTGKFSSFSSSSYCSVVADCAFLSVALAWHTAGLRAMVVFLRFSAKSPWALARRLLECDDEEGGGGGYDGKDCSRCSNVSSCLSSPPTSSSVPFSTTPSFSSPSPWSSLSLTLSSSRYIRVGHQLQVQASALRHASCSYTNQDVSRNHNSVSGSSGFTKCGRNSSSSSSSSSYKQVDNYGNNYGTMGVVPGIVVRGWLADPVIAAAMIEAAAPDALNLLRVGKKGALGGGKPEGGGGRRAGVPIDAPPPARPSISTRQQKQHQTSSSFACNRNVGKGFGSNNADGGGRGGGGGGSGSSFSSGSPATRAIEAARQALRFMSQLEPLMEMYQLNEPFVLVEMPFVPSLVELSVGGMALDWRALRRLRDDVDEQKTALQRLAETVMPNQSANFGGVLVTRDIQISLSSPKDVKEMVEFWNLPTLLRRGGGGGSRGMGKSDTKSDTLEAYVHAIEQTLLQNKKQSSKNENENEQLLDAKRFLECVLEHRRLDRLPTSLLSLQAYAVKLHGTTPPPPPHPPPPLPSPPSLVHTPSPCRVLSLTATKRMTRTATKAAVAEEEADLANLETTSLSSCSFSPSSLRPERRRSLRQKQQKNSNTASPSPSNSSSISPAAATKEPNSSLPKSQQTPPAAATTVTCSGCPSTVVLPSSSSSSSSSSSLSSSVTSNMAAATAPPIASFAPLPSPSPTMQTSSFVLDRVLPDVVHASAPSVDSNSGGCGVRGGGGAAAAAAGGGGVGLASTGRVSVRPLQFVQKEVRFRRPQYRSVCEDLRFHSANSKALLGSRCMLTFAGDGQTEEISSSSSSSSSNAPSYVCCSNDRSRRRLPAMRFSHGGSVRFGVLRKICPITIADAPAFGSRGVRGAVDAGDAPSRGKKTTSVNSSDGGCRPQGPALEEGNGKVLSVVEYWRERGFSYSDEVASSVLAVEVELVPGGFICFYPADQVFRIDHGSHIRFPDEESDEESVNDADSDDCDKGELIDENVKTSSSKTPSKRSKSDGDGDELNQSSTSRATIKSSQRERPWSCEVTASPRDVLVASPGRLFISADYAQVEVRLLAHYSEDQNLIAAFSPAVAQQTTSGRIDGNDEDGDIDGQDFFRRLARQWKQLPRTQAVSAEDRAAAKELCYGIVYGMGEGRLAAQMRVPISEARKHLRQFSARFREASEFKERVQSDCSRQDMTVRTLLGRQRCVAKVYTQAVNTVVQGSAADLIKVAMLRIQNRLKRELLPKKNINIRGVSSWIELENRCRLVNMLHDEVMYEVSANDADLVAKIIKEEMENALPCLKVPLKVELKKGVRWGNMSSF